MAATVEDYDRDEDVEQHNIQQLAVDITRFKPPEGDEVCFTQSGNMLRR